MMMIKLMIILLIHSHVVVVVVGIVIDGIVASLMIQSIVETCLTTIQNQEEMDDIVYEVLDVISCKVNKKQIESMVETYLTIIQDQKYYISEKGYQFLNTMCFTLFSARHTAEMDSRLLQCQICARAFPFISVPAPV